MGSTRLGVAARQLLLERHPEHGRVTKGRAAADLDLLGLGHRVTSSIDPLVLPTGETVSIGLSLRPGELTHGSVRRWSWDTRFMSKWRYTLLGWLVWKIWKRRLRNKLHL